jgi:hypothetical protein
MDTNGRGAVIEVTADGKARQVDLKPAFLDSTGTLTGQINYLGPINGGYPKITIAVYGLDRATLATKTGTYVLSDLPPGKYKLRISMTAPAAFQADLPETTLEAGKKSTLATVDLGQ